MASTHKHLRSSTANKRPTTAIADGQIALNTNTTSPGLFFKDSTGATIIKVGPVHVGSSAPNASPPAGGSSGNSTGEIWLDTSLTPNGVKIWNGASWTNATPIGSTTVQGLLELATSAETQTGTDTDRAVTPAGLQSKVSDSTSTTSSTTIASSTAVKSAYDLANAALPKTGGTVTGNLEIGTTGSLSFEGATADAFETTIAVVDPTADRTITLPDTTGTVVTTGDTGTVTSTMIADGTIVNGDINASAAIAGTKISPNFGSQNVTTTGTDTAASYSPTSSTAPTNGIYLPAANTVGISTGGTGRLFVNSSGNIGFGTSSPNATGFASTVATINIAASSNGGLEVTKNNVAAGHFTVESNANNDIRVGAVGASAALTFQTAGSERLRITSAGLVGVGTSSPSRQFSLSDTNPTATFRSTSTTGQCTLFFGDSDSDARGAITYENNGDKLGLWSAGGQKLTIDSSGNVGIGSSTPGAALDVAPDANRNLQVQAKGGTTYGLEIKNGTANSGGEFHVTAASSGAVVINRGSTEIARFNSTGLGIGTTAPGERLSVNDSGASAAISVRTGGAAFNAVMKFNADDTNYAGIGLENTALVMRCSNSSTPTERARIDSSGRLLVGTSSTLAGATDSLLQIRGNSSGSQFAGKVALATEVAAGSIVSGTDLGAIYFGNVANGIGGLIECKGDAQWGTNDYPGRLVFSTTADGASSPTERMRITQAGKICMGNSASSQPETLQVYALDSVNGYCILANVAGTGTRTHIRFENGNGMVGAINTNGTTTSYLTSSDYRLKENIAPVQDAVARLQQLKPCRFNFITDAEVSVDGFIAHEVQEVVPEAISGEKDAVDSEGNPKYQGIDQSKLVPLLTAALQEAVARIEQLEAAVATLQGS